MRGLVNFRIPTLSLAGFYLSWIPDINLGSIPGFNLPKIRINLKGILTFKDLLPDINLRALVYALAIKCPDINIPSLLMDLSNIFNIDHDILFPDLKLRFPDFFNIDLNILLPNIALPNINFPGLPNLDLPNLNLGDIDFSCLHIPNIDFPKMLKIPGFDKVMRLLFELFD